MRWGRVCGHSRGVVGEVEGEGGRQVGRSAREQASDADTRTASTRNPIETSGTYTARSSPTDSAEGGHSTLPVPVTASPV